MAPHLPQLFFFLYKTPLTSALPLSSHPCCPFILPLDTITPSCPSRTPFYSLHSPLNYLTVSLPSPVSKPMSPSAALCYLVHLPASLPLF